MLLRLDINSPIDPRQKSPMKIDKQSLPTINIFWIKNAKVAIIAHQGDTLDYQNLISMEEHAEKLRQKLGVQVEYVDDAAGGKEKVRNLRKVRFPVGQPIPDRGGIHL